MRIFRSFFIWAKVAKFKLKNSNLPHNCDNNAFLQGGIKVSPMSVQSRLLSLSPTSMSDNNSVPTQFIELGNNRRLAYKMADCPKTPVVVFVPGFRSTMEGVKAQSLEKFCISKGHRFIRFDFEGLGESPGKIENMFLKDWIENLHQILDHLVKDAKVLLIGSSMGGWISLKVAVEKPEKIHSLLLIAPAINFLQPYYCNKYQTLTKEQQNALEAGEQVTIKGPYGDVFLRKNFTEESMNHHIDFKCVLPIRVPVRILHGVQDPDVPFMNSLNLMEILETDDVDIVFRKKGKHQMSQPEDIELLKSNVEQLLSDYYVNPSKAC